jgi:hypothetical protein
MLPEVASMLHAVLLLAVLLLHEMLLHHTELSPQPLEATLQTMRASKPLNSKA